MHMPCIYGADKGSMSGAVKLPLYLLPFLTLKKVAVWLFYSHIPRFRRKRRIYLLTHLLKIEVYNPDNSIKKNHQGLPIVIPLLLTQIMPEIGNSLGLPQLTQMYVRTPHMPTPPESHTFTYL